jgi:hypothetical protein
VIKGGTHTGILTLQDGDVPAAGGVPAGSSITIAGSGAAVNGAQTVFQTTTNADTSQVTTRVGTSATNVSSTSLLQAGSNSVSVDSATGTTVTGPLRAEGNASIVGTLGVSGATTTNGITNNGNIGTGTLSTTGAATVGGSFGVTGASTFTGAATFNGNFAARGSQITLGAADGSSTVTIPGIASPGGDQRFVTTNSSGQLGYSAYTVNDYTNALQQVTSQISSAGAVAAALSAIPNLTTGSSRYGCGLGTGVFGSAWAGAAGCAAKVSNNVWVNGALSFTPSISTAFGSTPSVAGRLGVFWQF